MRRRADAGVRHKDDFINFPAQWRNPKFQEVLPRGAPAAQCLPVKRDLRTSQFGTIAADAVSRLQETNPTTDELGVYRRQFRAPKR
jgi:hypothetical protein